jgi:hypothetical protein
MLLNACKKDFSPKMTPDVEQTPTEKLLTQNLASVGTVLKELYKTPQHVKLVNIAIQSKVYTDESIILRDLLYPAESRLNNSKYFAKLAQKQNLSLAAFAEAFWSEANKNTDAAFKSFLTQLKRPKAKTALRTGENTNGTGDEVTIYFPYSELFLPPDGTEPSGNYTYGTITSLVTATEDADEGWGQQPVYLNGVLTGYRNVLVNDDYAEQYPTHIVGVNGIEIDNNEYPTTMDAPPPPAPPPGVNRVYIGEVVCKKQYDKFIGFNGNGGGSEVKLCRISGYLQQAGGQINNISGDEVDVDFTRKQIKDKKKKRVFSVWDDDWVQSNLEQIIGIYEDDDKGEVTFTGSIVTTVVVSPTVTTVGTIGFSIKKESADAVILQTKYSRNSYFTGAFMDQGWGFSDDATFLPPPFTHGWPWYNGNPSGGANLGYTWPYNVF